MNYNKWLELNHAAFNILVSYLTGDALQLVTNNVSADSYLQDGRAAWNILRATYGAPKGAAIFETVKQLDNLSLAQAGTMQEYLQRIDRAFGDLEEAKFPQKEGFKIAKIYSPGLGRPYDALRIMHQAYADPNATGNLEEVKTALLEHYYVLNQDEQRTAPALHTQHQPHHTQWNPHKPRQTDYHDSPNHGPPVMCTACGSNKHNANFCPRRATLQCTLCNKTGHTARVFMYKHKFQSNCHNQ